MSYLKPWRRKLGVVTLAFACLAMAGWARSLMFLDGVSWFSSGMYANQSLVSAGGYVSWQSKSDIELVSTFERYSAPLTADFDGFSHPAMKWSWRHFGFGSGHIPVDFTDGLQITMRVVPYWSIVIPLTLISLWLLLSKPRNSTVKKNNEQIPTEGT